MKPPLFKTSRAVALALVMTTTADAAVPATETKLIPSDPSLFRHFGTAVAVDGDTAVVGTPLDSEVAFSAGAVYVFVRSGSTWTQEAKLTASDAVGFSEFGYAVALSGDTVVVGAHLDPAGGANAGATYVFERTGSTWTQQAKLTPGDAAPNKQFGAAIAIEGDTVIAGAIGDAEGGFNAGAVYLFTRNGTTWTQQVKLLSSDPRPGNLFGFSVALDDATLAVGSPFDDDLGVIDAGAVYVFTGSGATWSQQDELMANDAATDDLLGWSLTLDGDTILVGAPQRDSAAESAGATYVFVRNAGVWSQQARLLADDGAAFDFFGYAVAVSGNSAVIGSALDSSFATFGGSAYVFTRSGTVWTQSAEFSASDIADSDEFGYAVAMSGTTILVGSPFSDGLDDGAAYLYSSDSNTAPVANPQMTGTSEDSAMAITLTGSDADGDSLTFTVMSNPTRGVLSGTAPNLLYAPDLNENGADSFTFKVNDGTVDSEIATVSITIAPVNDAPVANAQSLDATEDTVLPITLFGIDVEGNPLTFRVIADPAKGTLTGTPPGLTYTPIANENGADSFTFVVNDGALDSTPATVSLSIAAVNDGPAISDIADQSITENSSTSPIAFTVGDVDNDAGALGVSASSDNPVLVPSSGIVFVGSGANRTVAITPTTDQFGIVTIAVTVSDGLASASDTFVLTVTKLNRPPVADASASQRQMISPNNVSASVTLDGSRSSDPDGDALTYLWFAGSNLSAPIGTGVVGTLLFDVGAHEIVLRVSDGAAGDDDEIVVRVITAADATRSIMETVESSDIRRGKKETLLDTLRAAVRKFERGKMEAGAKQLQRFQQIVQSNEGKKIDPATAAALIAEAQKIIDAVTGV